MSVSIVKDERYIDELYQKLEEFDPECRHETLQILPSDLPEIQKEKRTRYKAYQVKCRVFNAICIDRKKYIQDFYALHIDQTLASYPENTIPESRKPILFEEAYRELARRIYEQNGEFIDTFVEGRFESEWQTKVPNTITKTTLKTGFRIVFGDEVYPNPSIIIAWDTKSPHRFDLDTSGNIVQS